MSLDGIKDTGGGEGGVIHTIYGLLSSRGEEGPMGCGSSVAAETDSPTTKTVNKIKAQTTAWKVRPYAYGVFDPV